MVNLVTQTFIPGPRLIDGTDLNTLVGQINNALGLTDSGDMITALNTVGAGTITAAGINGGYTSRGGAQSGTAFTDTTDTAAAIIALLPPGTPVGSSFLWTYDNTTNANATLAGGTGVTIISNSVIPLLTSASYLVSLTAAGALSFTFLFAGQLVPLPVALIANDAAQSATLNVTGMAGAQTCTVSLTGTTPGAEKIGPASAIFAAIPNARAGLNYNLVIRNLAATSCQFTGLTNVTMAGTTNINATSARTYNVSLDSLASITITGLTSTTL